MIVHVTEWHLSIATYSGCKPNLRVIKCPPPRVPPERNHRLKDTHVYSTCASSCSSVWHILFLIVYMHALLMSAPVAQSSAVFTE